jgi:hypothetical protein
LWWHPAIGIACIAGVVCVFMFKNAAYLRGLKKQKR